MSDFFEIYDVIAKGTVKNIYAENMYSGPRWTIAECQGNLGLAMTTAGSSIPPIFPTPAEKIRIYEYAKAIKSWNFTEASMALAACNAFYNSKERLDKLNCHEPYENYCTDGLDMSGAKIALIGHLTVTEEMQNKAEKIYILEKAPQPGDYPDSACDYILPQCDIVIITGSAIINKTFPHLLELCKNAHTTILAGPSVPMCPELLDFGIDRLSGMIVENKDDMIAQVLSGKPVSPYPYSSCFLLKK